MQPEDPPFLTVGTEVSAKYKGAFCEAKVHKVVKVVKIKVTFKLGLGSAVVSDEQVKGVLKIGAQVKASHPDKSQYVDAIINKIQDCSQYTVVFDDGDITTLRRSSLCLKSGRHFAESETLDQLPLTHPEHFGTPVGGSRRGRRSRQNPDGDESGEEEEDNVHKRHRSRREEWEADIGKVVCVELGDKKKMKDNWFPGLVVAPTAQDSVKIETKKDYLVRSFQDGRYYTVPKKEASPFSREVGSKVSQSALKTAVEKALLFMTSDELPPHWDRDLLFGMDASDEDSDRDGSDSDSSDDEPREEKDHFVAQLYKYMEECGTPINSGPTVGNKDLDLYKLFKVVQKLGGFNRVMNQNTWKSVSNKMQLQTLGSQAPNHIKNAYKKYLQSFEDFYRKLGCTMVSNPRGSRTRHRSGRSLIRDCDRTPRPLKKKGTESCDSTEDENEKKDDEEDDVKKDIKKEKDDTKKETNRKDGDEKDADKKDGDKREERKRDYKSAARLIKSEPNKSPERERSREPLLTRERSREPALTRERSREPMSVKEKSREPSIAKERNREASSSKDIPEPVTPKEKREPRTPRSEAKTRSAVKCEVVEVKTRSSAKEEKREILEVKTRSSARDDVKEKRETIKKEMAKKEEIKKEESEIEDEEDDDDEEEEEEEEEEEAEIEMAQTRSSRYRDDKVITPTRKPKAERTSSFSASTSSSSQSDNAGNDDRGDDIDVVSTSSNVSLLSSVGAALRKTKTAKASPSAAPSSVVPLPPEDLKKRGRKKKTEEVEHSVVSPHRGKALIPAHVPVNVGDKLRVLYGPNAKESKVTYEAKVLQVEESGPAPMYYVHYLGWNNRYDEWVRRPRIAENVTWSQMRTRKGRAAATKELKEKKEKEKEKGTEKATKKDEPIAAVPSPKSNLGKKGRTGIRERRESERSERSDTSGGSSISGPSTRATRDRGISQPDSPSSVDSKRTRRSNQDAADSDSEEYESDADTGSEKSRTRMIVERRVNALSTSSASSTPTSEPSTTTSSFGDKQPKDSKLKTQLVEVKKEIEDDCQEVKPCGKDIDLNAIMSEMKGLDKPIKKEEDRGIKDINARIVSSVPFTSPEKKSIDTPVKKSLEGVVSKKGELPNISVAQDSVKLLSPKLEFEDDIYEFKEPEPFDIGEMRARKETRTKNSIGVVEDQNEAEKFKKKGRPKKEVEGDRTESDGDSSSSPQKRLPLARESPSKRITGDSKESSNPVDSCTTPEKLDLITSMGPSIISPPRKAILRKDTPTKSEASLVSIPELKAVKPDIPKCPSPKLCQGEKPKSPSPLKEPARSSVTPVKAKLSSIEKPPIGHKSVVASSHILAQAVMPIIESRALAKPVPKSIAEPKVTDKSTSGKAEEKTDPKVMSFSQRQQQIFPHLLNRSENSVEKAKERVLSSPIQSPSRDATPVQDMSTSDVERIKRESSVEESIEAVIKRARQDDNVDESDKSESKLSPDKRRRTSNRVKKVLSREFLPDTSEESDSDCRHPRFDAERRMRKGRLSSDGEKMSPVKRTYGKASGDTDKKEDDRDDDDMDDEDADEDEDDNKKGSAIRVIKGGAPKKEETKFKDEEEDDEEEEEEEEQESQLSRKKPRASASATPKRLEDDEEIETGLGDLLCEETIPPGSPMTHDTATTDTDPPQRPDIKNEMPFASVPTGSSFGKRGPTPSTQHQPSQTPHPISAHQQQQQQQPPPPPSAVALQHVKQPVKRIPPSKTQQIVVPQAQQTPQKSEHHVKQQQKHNVPPPHLQIPQQQHRQGQHPPHLQQRQPQDQLQAKHQQQQQKQQEQVQQQKHQQQQQPKQLQQQKQLQKPLVPQQQQKSVPQQQQHQKSVPQPQQKQQQQQSKEHQQKQQKPEQQRQLQNPFQQGPTTQHVQSSQVKPQNQPDHSSPHPLKQNQAYQEQSSSDNLSTPRQQQVEYQPSRHNPNNNAIVSPNLAVVAEVAAAAASSRTVSTSSAPKATAASTSGADCGPIAASRNIRPSQNTVLDNTPPTTPESIISNLSDSPRGGDNEGPKMDESSKSGRDSSEMELDSLADNSKMDQFSEDSNTMDSTMGSESRHRGMAMKRQHEEHREHMSVNMADVEGSETEDGNSSVSSKRRKCRGPRSRACNEGDDEDSRKSSSQGAFPGRRRRRHSSSRGALQIDDDPETSGLSALSLACSAARRSRYNFCQELDPDLDATKRIAVLQSRIQELKRTYMQVKTELASVERRRKKLRRKEREKDTKMEPT